jgi:hypothetical protein
MSSEYVYCVKCPENERKGNLREKSKKSELESHLWNSWVCPECLSNVLHIKLIDFIKNRINVNATEDEDRSKFIFRELLQNADDSGSTILVLNFEQDALYVANNGRAFTVLNTNGRLSDFDRISQILGRHQADDKNTVGHFGSGFQTVYALTNGPEVHSSNHSRRMNPSANEWDINIDKRKSPYVLNKKKGVIFRLPWRDDEAAKEYIKNEQVFIDRNFWPRWNYEERRTLFDQLTHYLHQSILCCQNLKTVRLVWREDGNNEGYQVTRDYLFDKPTLYSSLIGTIKTGKIKPLNWTNDSIDIYREDSWVYESEEQYEYYIISGQAKNDLANRVYIGKGASNIIEITSHKNSLSTEIKKGDYQILLPLFNSKKAFPESKGRYYLYSVIPLPKRGKNRFAFSAHLFPTEERKDVDVEGVDFVHRDWYRLLMKNICKLYSSRLPDYIAKVKALAISNEEKEEIILNSLPNDILPEWMRPGKEVLSNWWEVTHKKTIQALLYEPILLSNDVFVCLNDAYWPVDCNESDVISILGFDVFSNQFLSHPNFNTTFAPYLQSRKINPVNFNALWAEFLNAHQHGGNKLKYNMKIGSNKQLNEKAINTLLNYCILRENAWTVTFDKQIVPGADEILRSISDYPKLPKEIDLITQLLPSSKIIHNDFSYIQSNEKIESRIEDYDCEAIVELIDEIVILDSKRFSNLSHDDHLLFSQLLKKLVMDLDFALKDSISQFSFIPYVCDDIVSIGTPNNQIINGRKQLISGSHIAENYQRESIYGVQSNDVPGLSSEVKKKIKFLSLIDVDESIPEIETKLMFVKLMDISNRPVNFVRHFLSPRHKSLFDNEELSQFIGISENELINKQKKFFLETIQNYFTSKRTERYLTPRDMSEVPCLFDKNNKWDSPSNFALNIDSELELFDYKSLHDDLSEWRPETLQAIGVVISPSSEKIVNTILSLNKNQLLNRSKLAKIILWLLTSNIKIDGEFNKLRYVSWIPTVDGSFTSHDKLIIPTSTNRKILGNDYEQYLDWDACSKDMRERLLDDVDKVDESRCQKLWIKNNPTFNDLLSTINKFKDSNSPPPEQLFDELNKEVGDKHVRDNFYYLEYEWVACNELYIMDKKSAPTELKDIYDILPYNHEHSKYIRYAGAKNRFSLKDILNPIIDGRLSPSHKLWDKIENYYIDEVTENDRLLYSDKEIYVNKGKNISPENILLIDAEKESILCEKIGKLHLIDGSLVERHGSILARLGSIIFDNLLSEDIIEIIEHGFHQQDTINDDELATVLFFLKRISSFDKYAKLTKYKIWPAQINGVIKMVFLADAYIDDSPFSNLFKEELAFLTFNDNALNGNLHELAINNGGKLLSKYLKKRDDGVREISSESYQIGFILKQLSEAISTKYYPKNNNNNPFAWLTNCNVYTSENLYVVYTIEDIEKKSNKYAIVEKHEEKNSIYVVNNNMKMYEELSEEIVNVSISPHNNKRDEMKFTIYQLLSHHPVYWDDLIPGYVYPLYDSPSIDEGKEPVSNQYPQVKNTLNRWYSSCQICGNQTPKDESGIETLETVKSIVTQIGGRYKGYRSEYSEGNCLLLCPRHQTLFDRGLIKFPELEQSEYPEIIEGLETRINEKKQSAMKNPYVQLSWGCEVFEGRRSHTKTGNIKPQWLEAEITFNNKHLYEFLKNMKQFLEEKVTKND